MEQSTQIQTKPSSSFSNSPKFLGGFLSRSMLDHPVISASPTSILDTKQFCNNNNKGNCTNHPIGYGDSVKPTCTEIKHKGIGLALEEDEDFDSFSKPNRKMVLFGAKLKKVQVPEPEIVGGPFPRSNNTSDLVDLKLKSPSDFGIKTKNLQLLHFDSSVKPQNCFRQGLSLSEMELSEEYTCVIRRNDPKIIHIFDDMIVETCCGGNLFDGLKIKEEEEEDGFKAAKGNNGNSLELVDFLGFCYTCKVKLGVDKDIYMYRGEKSFCSPECRFQEIIREEDEDN